MVTPMTDQPGRDSSDQPGSGRPGSGRPAGGRPASSGSAGGRPASGGSAGGRSGGSRSPANRPRPDLPGSELLTDFQRWLLKSGARSMRKELTGNVRRTLGGGRPDANNDVWDVATTEIPPEVGESPECQWCPVCRAARRMRDSGPGLGGQLSGAGDVVASAASDVISMIDSLLSRTGGTAAQRDRDAGSAVGGSAGRGPAGSGATGSGPASGARGPAGSDAARDDGSAFTANGATADAATAEAVTAEA